jgi:hypothetical protein
MDNFKKKNKNWQRYKFYSFPISLKKEIVFDSWTNDCIPSFHRAMSTIIFLQTNIIFCFSWGFWSGYIFNMVFFERFLRVLWKINEDFCGFLWWCLLAETNGYFLEFNSHLVEFNSHVAESSSHLAGF